MFLFRNIILGSIGILALDTGLLMQPWYHNIEIKKITYYNINIITNKSVTYIIFCVNAGKRGSRFLIPKGMDLQEINIRGTYILHRNRMM